MKDISVERRWLNVNDLVLDSSNPRLLDGNYSQGDIINHLLENEGALALALDIADKGEINPLENIGVMLGVDGRIVVLEGNRRCAAIKALNTPEVILSGSSLARVRKASREGEYDPIDRLECVVFESREDANEYIRIRHGGQAGGVGLRDWNPTQTENFRKRNNFKPLYKMATELLDWALRSRIISESVRQDVSITNIERMVKSPAVKAKMGITVGERDQLYSLNSFEWVSEFIKELVRRERLPANDEQRIDARRAYKSGDRERIANQIVVSVRDKGVHDHPLKEEVLLDDLRPTEEDSNGTDVECSADEEERHFLAEGGDNNNHSGGDNSYSSPVSPEQYEGNDVSQEGDAGGDVKGTRVPDQRRRRKLFSSDYKPVITNKILAKLHREIKNIEVDAYPTSSLFLVRSYLEVVFGLFCDVKRIDDGNRQLELRKKITRACDYLLNDGAYKEFVMAEGNALKQLKTIASDHSRLFSPDKINNIIHGGAPAPAYSEVIDAWSNIEKEMLCVLRALSEN